jgi:GTP-binding protein
MSENPTAINFRLATFYASYPELSQCDILHYPQIAFVGRSNAGKSSLLNALCDNKKLARTSNSPGRTQTVVMFTLKEDYALVDLPGYGYAKTSKTMRQSWGILLENYVKQAVEFNPEKGLLGLVIVVDSRRLLQDMDKQMIEFANFYGINICIFLTKIDKLNQQQKQQALNQTQKELQDYQNTTVLMGSSVQKKQGIDLLSQWMQQNLQS